ncbi:methyltransferase family protein [Allonocardiopsis opalescens]|uniref:Protein-S-isoprenylcysteine O-methyltransferase Ste14 n=1 Tax=Allonocardiopsis opalescens TaxID=1144618 RepID=A0A2T0PX66_9ACTN|nr:methyltransferase [Allonocardiopsis opalescens]PRX96028.1 protein-S-isoprenylcysteine O-methyltransferase Ste14 [Allonocardiopsis opalescens]
MSPADPALIRGLALFGPLLALAAAVALRRRSGRRSGRASEPGAETGAAVVATAWTAASLYALNQLAPAAGWWHFAADGALARGLPVDLWIGWAVLWGALPALAARGLPLALTAAAAAWLDLALMPLAEPVVVLGPNWLAGEAVAVAGCLLPAVLLARWTAERRRPRARAAAQALLAGALMLALPLHLLGAEPAWPAPATGVLVQLLALVLLPGLAAAAEFARTGGGTPLPYDPPVRLVTSGPYAYVRNPMQLAMALAYPLCALAAAEPRLLAGTAAALACGGLAAWHENGRLDRAFGPGWRRYRRAVRPWLPSWRPWPGRPAARLYLAGTCSMCRGLGRWLAVRGPVALELLPAEEHGAPDRMTYTCGPETRTGTAALARALEHLHLGWALLGWALALPGAGRFVQLCADAFGAGPRTLRPAAPPPGRPGAGAR